MSEPLTFAGIDDLAFAAFKGILSTRHRGPALSVRDLGPFVE
jgi:hypothetical protein